MVTRKYREVGSSVKVAGIIGSEVIESGKSEGWQGSLEELANVEKILSKYNIAYIDDVTGRWGYTEKKQPILSLPTSKIFL